MSTTDLTITKSESSKPPLRSVSLTPEQEKIVNDLVAFVKRNKDAKYEEGSRAVQCSVTGLAGTGKALRVDQPVLTPSGYVRIDSLEVGDDIVGADGKTYQVTGVYPQGIRELYEVKFSDGTAVIADGDHIWSVQRVDERLKGVFRNRTTLELSNKLTTPTYSKKMGKGERAYWFMPMCAPVEFVPKGELPIDPWLLGFLLGDGSLSTDGTIRFSTSDESIAQKVDDTIFTRGLAVKHVDKYDYSITAKKRGSANNLLEDLRSLKLMGTHSHDKFIPVPYLYASPEERLAILQGIMDADGYAAGSGVAELTITSFPMGQAVKFIAESLGGTATVQYGFGECNGKLHRETITVRVKLPKKMNPFSLPRKADNLGNPQRPPFRTIKSITKVDDGAAVCISVNSPDKLYLTTGCVPTHNTTVAAEFIRRLIDAKIMPLVMAPTGKAADVLTRKFKAAEVGAHAYTIHSAMCGEVNAAMAKIDAELDKLTQQPQDDPEVKQRMRDLKHQRREIEATRPKMSFGPKNAAELFDFDVMIFDEASMIGRSMYEQLIEHHRIPRIYFGDYGQLPPVLDKPAIKLKESEYKLTKILRQDADSGLLPLSHFIYHQQKVPPLADFKQWHDVQIVKDIHPVVMSHYYDTHQAICYTNATRHRVNSYIRKRKAVVPSHPDPVSFPFTPAIGETLILKTNNRQREWVNGMRVVVEDILYDSDYYGPLHCRAQVSFPDDPTRGVMWIPFSLLDLSEGYQHCPARKDKMWDSYSIRARNAETQRNLCSVQFAYCITGHTSQGSEYDHVVVFSEMRKSHPEWAQWNYTAITRAKKSVVIAGML